MSMVLSYKELLNKKKKNELVKIIDNYNKYCDIFVSNKLENYAKKNKKDLISIIEDIHSNFVKYLIMLLDNNDHELLKNIINKKSILDIDKKFIKYLNEINILFKEDMSLETFNYIKKYLKDKEIEKIRLVNNKYYNLSSGLILAYGVVEKELFNKYCNLLLIENYYKNEIIIKDDKVYSNKLINENKINKYYKDNNYKIFTNKELLELGLHKYHYKLKSFKKLVKILKRYYVFKKRDIEFLDEKVVRDYLYNSLQDRAECKKILISKIEEYFEYKDDKLKDKLISNIENVRDEFPVWEYRGYSIKEVKKDE